MPRSDLWSQIKYLAPYKYVLDSNIVEFDIEKANINVLLYCNAIDQETYNKLYALPKDVRERRVGLMIRRTPGLSKVLKDGIQEARHKLFETLQLDSSNVLAINNDAVFVIFSGPSNFRDVQINELVKFKVKGTYRSFYYLNKKQFYYTYDPVTYREGLDIKGVGDYGVATCHGFIRLLCDIFYSYLTSGPSVAYDTAVNIYHTYANKKYPMEFYRRLDSHARYDIYPVSNYFSFQAETLDTVGFGAIDPSYNLNMIRSLITYYTEELLKQI